MARNDLLRLAQNLDRFATAAFSRAPAAAAEKVVNELQTAGPVWSGQFANSWAIASGSRQTQGSGAPGQPKRLSAPLLTGRELVFKPEIKYTIFNTADYAAIAQDLEPGVFKKIGRPLKPTLPGQPGIRSGGIRGKVGSGDGGAESTAPLDWFSNYLSGGGLDKAVEVAFNATLPKTL
jgi:hypothetical protein